ncbi:MAG: hypothetical protein R3C19_23425 [Planctomycetaceae bacterium]
MSTTAGKTAYAECDEFIDYQIQVARERIRWTDLLTASVLTGILLVGYVLTFTVFDHWIVDGGFRPWTRAILLVMILVLCAGIVVRFVIRPWMKRIHPLYAARMLDRSDQGMNGALLSLVDLKTGNHKAADSIRTTLEKRAAVRLAEINVDEAIDRRWLMKLGTLLFVLVFVTCLYAVFSPKSISLLRPLTLLSSRVATRTAVLQVQPGDVTLPAGSQLEIIADISGRLPEQVSVLFTTADRRFVNEALVMQPTDDERRFSVLMVGEADRGIRQDLTYHIVAGDATSEEYTITVDQPPRAEVTAVEFRYPDYMDLPPRQSDSADIEAWEGSVVSLTAQSSVPVDSAAVRFSDDAAFSAHGEEVGLKINGTTLTGRFELIARDDGTFPAFYRIEVEDDAGRTDPSPTVHRIRVRQDQAPVVKLLDPIRDLRVPANAIVPMLIEARDPDFLLRSVTLFYEINGHPVEPGDLIFDGSRAGHQQSFNGTWELKLAPLDLKSGDIVRYSVAARDNKPPLGNQGRTGTLQLEIQAPVSDKEVQDRLQQDRELQQRQMRERAAAEVGNDDTPDDQEKQPDASASDAAETTETEASESTDADSPDDSAAQDNAGQPGVAGAEQPGDDGTTGGTESAGNSTGDQSDGDRSATPQKSADGSPNGSRTRPASDDEALAKLIEKYQRSGDGKDGTPDQNASDQNTDSEAGAEHSPEDRPGNSDSDSAAANGRNEVSDDKSGESGETGDAASHGDETGARTRGLPDRANGDDPTNGSDAGQPGESDRNADDATSTDTPSAGGEGADTADESTTDDDNRRNGEPSDGSNGEGASAEDSATDNSGNRNVADETQAANGDTNPVSQPEGNPENSAADNNRGEGRDSENPEPNDDPANSAGGQGEGADSQQDGKQGGNDQQQQGGGQEGGGQQGGGQEGGGKQGGGQEGGGKQGGGQAGGEGDGGKGGEAGGGGGTGGKNGAGGSGSGKGNQGGSGPSTPLEPAVDPNVEDAAKAADLALKRLQQDLERGKVDREMLEELGWTEDQLDAFRQRMQKQLQNLNRDENETTAEALQRRRTEELLKSMNLDSDSVSRRGDSSRDREQQDTTVRRPDAPSRYRNRFEMYQRSISGVRDRGMQK